MSLLKAWKSVASIRGGSPDSPPRKDRFSLRPRQLPRRPGTALDVELRDSPDKTWPRAPAPNGSGDGRETTLERSFTLSILEGRKQPPASLRESTGTTSTCVSGGGDGAPGGGAVVAAKTSTPLVPPRSRARSASVGSSRSLSDEGRRRKASLVPQTLGVPELEEPRPDSAGAHPPTYSSAAYPTHDVAYRFAQAGPFGMSLEAEAAGLAHVWRYQVEVGVNVLTLRSWVTTVRRGGEDGLLVAEIE